MEASHMAINFQELLLSPLLPSLLGLFDVHG